MAKIFLSIPILDRPEFRSIYSVYFSMFTCKEHQLRIHTSEGCSLIERARNSHISAFLDDYKECDYFMSLDSDIEIINCFSNNNIFKKLIDHDLDFVGGLYALKSGGTSGKPICSSLSMKNNLDINFDVGLIEMKYLSTGCWMLKRSVVEKMANAYPELIYDGDGNDNSSKKQYGLFLPIIKEFENPDGTKYKKLLTEDWSFVERWRQIGGKVFADTSIVLNHIGKYPYMLWNVSCSTKQNT